MLHFIPCCCTLSWFGWQSNEVASCSHRFCSPCIERWAASCSSCPLCKRDTIDAHVNEFIWMMNCLAQMFAELVRTGQIAHVAGNGRTFATETARSRERRMLNVPSEPTPPHEAAGSAPPKRRLVPTRQLARRIGDQKQLGNGISCVKICLPHRLCLSPDVQEVSVDEAW